MKVVFLTHNLKQDNGAGVFSLRLIEGLKKESAIETITFTSEGGRKLFLDIFKLRRAIKNCDIVHALDAYPYGVAAYLASIGLGKKIIITAVGSGAIIHLYKWPYSFLLKRAYKRADKVTAVSNFTKNEILKKIPGLNIEVINHGVDFEQFGRDVPKTQILQDLAQRDGASRAIPQQRDMRVLARFGVEAPYLLSVGSLRWRKGYHRSIEAFKKISEAMPDLHYVIVGKKYTDDYYERLKKLISGLGLENRVHILDNVNGQSELIDIYKNAELFCLMPQTANRDMEGFGLVFLEAAASGLPVVGTNGSGAEDAVLEGINGYLTGPRDISGFADKVVKILKDKALRAKMAEASLEFAKNSGWDKKIAEYSDLYKKLSKPKIVYVTNARLPTEKAHGLATVKIAEALGDLGYDVDLIAPRRRGMAMATAQALQDLAQRDGARLSNSPAGEYAGLEKSGANAPDIFTFYQIRRNFKIIKLPTIDLFGFLPEKAAFFIQLFSFSKISTIYSLFKYRGDTIFFSHDHVPLYFLSLFGRKIFYDIHHFPDHNIFYERVLKKSTGLAVQTKWKVGELEKEFGISKDKIVYWPNGTDVEKFNIELTKSEARTQLGLPQDKKIILYTGQLFDWKGVETLIEATDLLREVEIYIVGGDLAQAQSLQDLAQRDGASRAIPQQRDMRVLAKPGAKTNLHFTGQRPHEEIPLWLRAADVLVLPNTGKQKVSLYYTSPMKMFEYMASNTPIVASRIPSITEILNEHNAVLAEADNSKSFAERIEWVLGHSFESSKISAQAQKDVQKYTWLERVKKISEKFISI